MKKIKDSSTEIFIGEDVLSHLDKYLSMLEYSSVVFIVDENSEQHTLPLLQKFVNTLHASPLTTHTSRQSTAGSNIKISTQLFLFGRNLRN